jgi:hypothetical protein
MGKNIALIFLSVFLTSCAAVPAPQYQVSKTNIESLEKIGDFKLKVEKFTQTDEVKNNYPISLRAANLKSPVGESFAEYVEDAVKKDLMLADKYSPESTYKIGGVLIRNDLDASGINTGEGIVEAEFYLQDGEKILYKKTITQKHTWESSFLGAIAIQNAIKQYPVMIEKLLIQLFGDDELKKEIKRHVVHN